MKKYVKCNLEDEYILSSMSSTSPVDRLTKQQLIEVYNHYLNSDGTYGDFDSVTEMARFMHVVSRLEELGYEI